MILKSNKTGMVHYVSKEDWDLMRKKNISRHYEVIDSTDEEPKVKDIKVEPVEMVNKPDEKDEAGEIREQLREAGIYFHPNTGIVKLKELLETI
jgi:hypothetical protein